eukprot:1072049-Rhodomonas_salina.1
MQQQLQTVPMCAECYKYAQCNAHRMSSLLPMGMTSVHMDDPNMEEETKNEYWGRIGINDFAQEFFRRGAELKPESMGYVIDKFQENKLNKTFYDKNRYSETFRYGVASAFGLFVSYLQAKYPDQDIQQEDVLIWFLNSIHGTFSGESVYDDATYAKRFVTEQEDRVIKQYKIDRQNHDHDKRVVQPRGSPHEEKKRDADEERGALL